MCPSEGCSLPVHHRASALRGLEAGSAVTGASPESLAKELDAGVKRIFSFSRKVSACLESISSGSASSLVSALRKWVRRCAPPGLTRLFKKNNKNLSVSYSSKSSRVHEA